jgi:predicted lipoprotein with Yx(FWY)xxD motif
MRHPRITVAAVAVAVAATVGGLTITSSTGTSTSRYPTGATMPLSLSTPGQAQASPATVQAATAQVRGTPETILEDAKGLPLYIYRPDTPTTSHVNGQLAALWPPLVAKTPTAAGATGTLMSVATSNGQQVSYNGHFLYTFVEDRPGHVTGQGVQNFFVATPDLSAASPTVATSPPAATTNGYGSGY